MKSKVLLEKFKERRCSKCNLFYPLTPEFFQKQKERKTFRKDCKICHNKKIKEWSKTNEIERTKYYKEYCKNNKESINKIKREYKQERKKIDSLYKVTVTIRNTLSWSFKKKNFTKNSKTYDLLGCTFDEFKEHIEKQFLTWMSWDNYGKYNGEFNFGWDFDHKIPLSSAKTYEEIIKLNHYTNFQPLCSKINRDIKK